MLKEKFKRGIAALLVVCMTISTNGFSTLANSVGELASDAEQEGSMVASNYYYEYVEEKKQITIVKNSGVIEDETTTSVDDVDKSEESVDSITNDTQEVIDKDVVSNDIDDEVIVPHSDEEDEEIQDVVYEEELEEELEEESENEDAPSENNDNENNEIVDDIDNENEEETTTQAQENEEEQNIDTENETTIQDEVETTTQDETEETTTTKEEATTQVEFKETVIQEETTTQEEIESVDEEATESEIENEVNENADEVASESNIDYEALYDGDIIASESEMEFIDDASGSNVRRVKRYIKASNSIVKDGPSIWVIKKFLYEPQVGNAIDFYDNDYDGDKYLKKTIKVLLVDQYNDEKVVEIPVTWDKERVDINFGYKPEKMMEHIKVTKDEALTLDENKTFKEQIDNKEFKEELKDEKEVSVNDIAEVKLEDDNTENKNEDAENVDAENKNSDIENIDDPEVKSMSQTFEEQEEAEEDTTADDAQNSEQEVDSQDENIVDTHAGNVEDEIIEDGNDLSIEEGGEVIYEDIIVDSEEEALEKTEKDKVIEGNANSNFLDDDEIQTIDNITPNMLGVMKNVAEQIPDGDVLEFNPSLTSLPLVIVGAGSTHVSHAICGDIGYDINGNAVADGHYCRGDHFDGEPSDGARHSNQIYLSKIASTGETDQRYFDFEWQMATSVKSLISFATPTEIISKYINALDNPADALLAVDTYNEKNYIALGANLYIDEPVIVKDRSLHLCLNGYALAFGPKGRLIVDGGIANEITICDCQAKTAAEIKAAISGINYGNITNFVGWNATVSGKDITFNQAVSNNIGCILGPSVPIEKITTLTAKDSKENVVALSSNPTGLISMLGEGNIYIYGKGVANAAQELKNSITSAYSQPTFTDNKMILMGTMQDNSGTLNIKDCDASFIYAKENNSKVRQFYMTDVFVANVHGVYNGFANINQVDSAIINRCQFVNNTALKGAIANMRFDGENNKFAEVMNCAIRENTGGVGSSWTLPAGADIVKFYKDNNTKGLIDISNYSSSDSADGKWRRITDNGVATNKLQLGQSVFGWDTSVGTNALYFGNNNIIQNDGKYSSDITGVDGYSRAQGTYNLNSKNSDIATNVIKASVSGVVGTFTSQKKEGQVHIFNNIITYNNSGETVTTTNSYDNLKISGSLAFDNLSAVFYNIYNFTGPEPCQEWDNKSGFYGGSIIARNIDTMKVQNTRFYNCETGAYGSNGGTYGFGGAIYAEDIDNLELGYTLQEITTGGATPDDRSMLIFEENEAKQGGAVYVSNNTLYGYDPSAAGDKYENRNDVKITNVEFKNNIAKESYWAIGPSFGMYTYGQGGALYVENKAARGNDYTKQGAAAIGTVSAAIAHGQDEVNISGCTFEGNKADKDGGTIYVDSVRLKFGILLQRKSNIIKDSKIRGSATSGSNKNQGVSIYSYNGRITVPYDANEKYSPLIIQGCSDISHDIKGNIYIISREGEQSDADKYITYATSSYTDGGIETFDCDFGSTIFYGNEGSASSYLAYDGGAIMVENAVTNSFVNLNLHKGVGIYKTHNPIFIKGCSLNFDNLTKGYNSSSVKLQDTIIIGYDDVYDETLAGHMGYDHSAGENGIPSAIKVERNYGDYIIGNDPSNKNIINMYGGEIVNNYMNSEKRNGSYTGTERPGAAGIYAYTDEGIFAQKSTSGGTVSRDGIPVYVYFAGNAKVYGNLRAEAGCNYSDIITDISNANWYQHNLPLQELQKDGVTDEQYPTEDALDELERRYIYRIVGKVTKTEAAGTVEYDYRLHKNAVLSFTPMEIKKEISSGIARSIQLFGTNNAMFTDEYIIGIGSGADVGSMLINSKHISMGTTTADYEDQRVVYAKTTKELMMTDLSQLLVLEFEYLDLDESGNHTRVEGNELPSQYVQSGATLVKAVEPNAISDNEGTFKYTKTDDPNYARIFDVMGDLRYWELNEHGESYISTASHFEPWNFNQKFNFAAPYSLSDPQQRNKLYVIYALMNHSHKVCGEANDYACDCKSYYTGRDEWNDNNIVIQVATLAQLFYAKRKPQYMYALTDDIEISDITMGRLTHGIINDVSDPIDGLKLCLNGHKITVATSGCAFALSGNCYICDCGGVQDDAGTTFKNEYMGTLQYKDGIEQTKNLIEIAGKDDLLSNNIHISAGHFKASPSAPEDYEKIKISHIPGTNGCGIFGNNNIGNNSVSFERVSISENGTVAKPLKSTLLDLPFGAGFIDVSIRDNVQQPDDTSFDYDSFEEGQGLIRLYDGGANSSEHDFDQIVIKNNKILSKNSAVIYARYGNSNSVFNIHSGNEDDEIIKRSVIKDNKVVNRAVISFVKHTMAGIINTIDISNVDFDNNTVDRTYTVNISGYGSCIGLKGQAGTGNINNCNFTNNGYADEDYVTDADTNNKLYGGAIYIGDVPESANNKSIQLQNCNFKHNIAYYGGALAMNNSTEVKFASYEYATDNTRSALFDENIALYGSAIYDNEGDGEAQGRKTYSQLGECVYFENNGKNYTKGTIYLSGGGSFDVTVEGNMYARGNKGEISFLCMNGYRGTFSFEKSGAIITENAGGSVIEVENDTLNAEALALTLSANAENVQYKPTNYPATTSEGIKITNNNTKDKDAIIINRETTTILAGVLNIKDNLNDSGEQSNYRISTYSQISNVSSAELTLNVKKTDYNPFASTEENRTPRSQIHYTVDSEDASVDGFSVPCFLWTQDSIDIFGIEEYFYKNIFVLDDKANSDTSNPDIVIYKGEVNDTQGLQQYIKIGRKENAKHIRVWRSENDLYTDFYAEYDSKILLDHFHTDGDFVGTEGAYPNYKYPYDYSTSVTDYDTTKYPSLTFKNAWIGDSYNLANNQVSSAEYRDTTFKNTYFMARNDGTDQDICAEYTINHANTACGDASCDTTTPHNNYGEITDSHSALGDTILAFKPSTLQYKKDSNAKFLLSADILVDRPIVNARGYNLCLNGHNIKKLSTVSFIEMNAAGTNITIHDCDTNGTYASINPFIDDADVSMMAPFIKLDGTAAANVSQRPKLSIYGKRNNANTEKTTIDTTLLNYDGEDGYLIVATNANINLSNVTIKDTLKTTKSSFEIVDSTVNMFSTEFVGDALNVTYEGSNGLYHYTGSQGIKMINVQYHDYKINADKALISMKEMDDLTGGAAAVEIESKEITENGYIKYTTFNNVRNIKDNAKGGAFYIKNIENIKFTAEAGIENIPMPTYNATGLMYFKDVFASDGASNFGYGASIYVDDATKKSHLTTKDVFFSGTDDSIKAREGGAIYVANDTVDDENAINHVELTYYKNEAAFFKVSAKENGGAVVFKSAQKDIYSNIFELYSINGSESVAATGVYNCKSTDGNGGFGYFEDTKVYVDTDAQDGTTHGAGNQVIQFGDDGSYFANMPCEAPNGHGGVIFASRSEVYLGNVRMQNCKADKAGAAVAIMADYKDESGEILDKLYLGQGKFAADLANPKVVDIGGCASTFNQGIIYVGRYSNFYLDGKVKVGTNDSKKNLFLNGNYYSDTDDGSRCGVSDYAFENLGIERMILSNFDYDNSEIYTTVSLFDERIIGGWTESGAETEHRVFESDLSKARYITGRKSSRNIHIGDNKKSVIFVADGGTMHMSTGDVDFVRHNVGVGAPVELDTSDTGYTSVEKSGYEFKGWVTSVYDYVVSKSYIGRFDTSLSGDLAQSVYLDAQDECLYVYPIFVNTSKSGDRMCASAICDTDSLSHNHNEGHDAPDSGWVEVNHYEQLFYREEGMEYGFYLNHDLVDKKQNTTDYLDGDVVKPDPYQANNGAILEKTDNKIINLNGKNITMYNSHGFFDGEQIILSNSEDATSIIAYVASETLKEDFIRAQKDIEIYGNIEFNNFKIGSDYSVASLMRNYGSSGEGSIYIEGKTQTDGIKIQGEDTNYASASNIISDFNGIYIKNTSIYYTNNVDITSGGDLYIENSEIYQNKGLIITAPANLTKLANIDVQGVGSYGMHERDVLFNMKRFSENNINSDINAIIYNMSTVSITSAGSDDTTYNLENLIAVEVPLNNEVDFKINNLLVDNVKGTELGSLIGTIVDGDDNISDINSSTIINISNSDINNIDKFKYTFGVFGASLKLDNVNISNNNIVSAIIRQVSNYRASHIELFNTNITNNTVGDSVILLSTPIRKDGGYESVEADRLHNVIIKDNTLDGDGYAYQYVGSNPDGTSFKAVRDTIFTSQVYIYDNKKLGEQRNLMMHKESDPNNGIKFLSDDNMTIASNSKIGVSVDDDMSTEEDINIVFGAWKNDVIEPGVTDAIWYADNDVERKIYKNNEDIVLGRKTNTNIVEIHYDFMGREVYPDSVSPYHYVINDSAPDIPQIPREIHGVEFNKWFLDKEMTRELVSSTGDRQAIEGVDRGDGVLIATLYAVFKHDLIVVVNANTGGESLDGSVLSLTTPSKAIYKVRMGENLSQSKRLKESVLETNNYFQSYDATEHKYNHWTVEQIEAALVSYMEEDSYWDSADDNPPVFIKEGMSQPDNLTYWTQNGWNNGTSTLPWGEEFIYNSTNVANSQQVYVKWNGEKYELTAYLRRASGSFADSLQVLNASDRSVEGAKIIYDNSCYDVEGVLQKVNVVVYYNSLIEELPKVTRDGYYLYAWHKDESLSEESIIKANDISGACLNEYTEIYPEWRPNEYDIVYSALDADTPIEGINYPGMDIPQNATYSQTMTFDKTEKIWKNKYKKIGHKFTGWVNGYDNIDDEFEYTYATHPQKTTDSLIYTAKWEKIPYTLTLDLNDGFDGHNSGYRGSTKAKLPIGEFGVEMSSKSTIYYKDVLDLPTPTRPGYTFGGWSTVDTYGALAIDGEIIENGRLYDYEAMTTRDGDNWIIATNSTLYALWEANKFTMEIVPNDPEVEYDPTMILSLPYSFDGAITIPQNQFKLKGFTYKYMEVEDTLATYSNVDNYVDVNTGDVTEYKNLGYDKEVGIASGSVVKVKAIWDEHTYTIKYHTNNPVDVVTGEILKLNDAYYPNDVGGIGKKVVTREVKYREIVRPINGFKYSDVDPDTVEKENNEIEQYDGREASISRETYLENIENNLSPQEINGYIFDAWYDNATKSLATYNLGAWISTSSLAGSGYDSDGEDKEVNLYASWKRNPYYIVYVKGDTEEDNDGSTSRYHDYQNEGEFAHDEVIGSLNNQTIEYGVPTQLYEVEGGDGMGEGMHLSGHTFDYWALYQAYDKDGVEIIMPSATNPYFKAEVNTLAPEMPSTFSNADIVKDITNEKAAKIELKAIWKQNKYTVHYDYATPTSPKAGEENIVTRQKEDKDITYRYQYMFADEGMENIDTDAPYIKGYRLEGFYDDDGNVYNIDYASEKTDQRSGGDFNALHNSFARMRASESDAEVYTLHASWSNAYVLINFNANAEDIDPTSRSLDVTDVPAEDTYYARYDLPYGYVGLPTPSRAGYTFMGWTRTPYEATDSLAENLYVRNTDICRDINESDPDVAATTLYAHWKKNDYKVKVYANSITGLGGEVVQGKIYNMIPATSSYMYDVVYDAMFDITQIATSYVPGYTFIGYSRESENPVPEDDAEILQNDDDFNTYEKRYWAYDNNQVINAQYRRNTYTLKFDKGHDDAVGYVDPITLSYDVDGEGEGRYSLAEAKSAFTRDGFEFDYFEYQDMPIDIENPNSFIQATYSDTDTVYNLQEKDGGEVTLKAVWKEQEYNIHYLFVEPESDDPSYTNPSSVTSMPVQTLAYTASQSLLPNEFLVDGYEFDHWAEANEVGEIVVDGKTFLDEEEVSRLAPLDEDTKVIQNNEYYLVAVFNRKEYEVVFDLNDVTTTGFGTSTASMMYRANAGDAEEEKPNATTSIAYDTTLGASSLIVNDNPAEIKNVGYYAKRRGYDFLGWSLVSSMSYFDRADGINTISSEYIHRATTSQVKLYAVWKNHEVQISFNIEKIKNPPLVTTEKAIGFYDAGGEPIGYSGDPNFVDPAAGKTFPAYFDMPYGVDTETMDPTNIRRKLPTAKWDNFGPLGWYHDDYDIDTTPSDAYKVVANTICDIDTSDTNATMYMFWSGDAFKMTLDPVGGTMRDYNMDGWTTAPLEYTVMKGDVIGSGGHIHTGNDFIGPAVYQYDIYKKGYDFEGWQTESGETKTATDEYWADGPATLSATWNVRTYKIHYNENKSADTSTAVDWSLIGGGSADTEINFADAISSMSTFKRPLLPGYTLEGWYTNANGTGTRIDKDYENGWNYDYQYPGEDFVTKVGDEYIINVYAKWQVNNYIITFDSNKGSGTTTPSELLSTKSITYDTNITGIPSPTRTGYTFGGYYGRYLTPVINPLESSFMYSDWAGRLDETGGTKFGKQADSNYDQNPEDKTYMALWLPNEIQVHFDGNKGSGSTNIDSGSLSNDVYVFFDDTISAERDLDYIPDMIDSHGQYQGAEPTRPGYTFVGWNTKADRTGATISVIDKLNESNLTVENINDKRVTLYAQWEANIYTVTLNPNDYTNTSPQRHGSTTADLQAASTSFTVIFDSRFSADNLIDITRPGYTFMGWYTQDGFEYDTLKGAGKWIAKGNKIVADDIYSSAKLGFTTPENVTLYALWDKKAITINLLTNRKDGQSTDGTLTGLVQDEANVKYHYNELAYFDTPLQYTTKDMNGAIRHVHTDFGYSRMGYEYIGVNKASNSNTGEVYDSNVPALSELREVGDHYELDLYVIWKAATWDITFDTAEKGPRFSATDFDAGMTVLPYANDVDTIEYQLGVYYPSANNNIIHLTFDELMHISTDSSAVGSNIYTSRVTLPDGTTHERNGFDLQSLDAKTSSGRVVVEEDTIKLDKDFVESLQHVTHDDTQGTGAFTLYPTWVERIYTITTNSKHSLDPAGGGSDVITTYTVSFNELKNIPKPADMDGYTFDGWCTNPSIVLNPTDPTQYKTEEIDKNQKFGRMKSGGETLELYAVWRRAKFPVKYKNSNSGAEWTSEELGNVPKYIDAEGILYDADGINQKDVGTITVDGAEFSHWRWTDLQTGNVATASTVAADAHPFNGFGLGYHEPINAASVSELVFYAVLNEDMYTVILEANGATNMPSQHVLQSYNSPFIIFDPGFSYPGYYIAYWSLEQRGESGARYSAGQGVSLLTPENPNKTISLWPIWSSATGHSQQSANHGSVGGGGGGGGGGGSVGGGGTIKGGIQPNVAAPMAQNLALTSKVGQEVTGNWVYNPLTDTWTFNMHNRSLGLLENQNNNNVVGFSEVGLIAAGGFYLINTGNTKSWFAFDDTGKMVTGLYQDPASKAIYYCRETKDDRRGQVETGYQVIGGKTYYFGQDGKLVTSGLTPDGRVINADGTVVTVSLPQTKVQEMVLSAKGTIVTGGYSISPVGEQIVLQISDPRTYQLTVAPKGWYSIQGNDGKMRIYHVNEFMTLDTGLITDELGNQYYFSKVDGQDKCAMATGVVKIGTEEYYFQDKANQNIPLGCLIKNGILPDGRKTDANGKVINVGTNIIMSLN